MLAGTKPSTILGQQGPGSTDLGQPLRVSDSESASDTGCQRESGEKEAETWVCCEATKGPSCLKVFVTVA